MPRWKLPVPGAPSPPTPTASSTSSRANQLFGEGAAERLKAIKAPALLVYSPTDAFFPPDSVKRTAEAIKANGAAVETFVLDGKRGHLDGVLSIKSAEKEIAALLAK